jgi:hypothetical protein
MYSQLRMLAIDPMGTQVKLINKLRCLRSLMPPTPSHHKNAKSNAKLN